MRLFQHEKMYMYWVRYLRAVARYHPKKFEPLTQARYNFRRFAGEWHTSQGYTLTCIHRDQETLELALGDFVKQDRNIKIWAEGLVIPKTNSFIRERPHKPSAEVREQLKKYLLDDWERQQQERRKFDALRAASPKIHEDYFIELKRQSERFDAMIASVEKEHEAESEKAWQERVKFDELLAATLVGVALSLELKFTEEELYNDLPEEVYKYDPEECDKSRGLTVDTYLKKEQEKLPSLFPEPIDWVKALERLTDFKTYMLNKIETGRPDFYIFPGVRVDIRVDDLLHRPDYEPPVYYSWLDHKQYVARQVAYWKNMEELFKAFDSLGNEEEAKGKGDNSERPRKNKKGDIDEFRALADVKIGGLENFEAYRKQHPETPTNSRVSKEKGDDVSSRLTRLNKVMWPGIKVKKGRPRKNKKIIQQIAEH